MERRWIVTVAVIGVLVFTAGCQKASNPVLRKTGPEVADALQARFDDLRADCGSTALAPVECSGVLFRGTLWTQGQHSWLAPGRPQGVSFSWIRQDVNFSAPAGLSGFIVYPSQEARRQGLRSLIARCVYVSNAYTNSEPDDRCRAQCDDPAVRVRTAVEFLREYPDTYYGCAFRAQARPDAGDDVAYNWAQAAAVRKTRQYFDYNEVIVAPWPDDVGANMPVEAFFYLTPGGTDFGLENARKDQVDFLETTGRWVPMILWKQATKPGERVIFDYVEADQAVHAPARRGR